MHELAEGKHPVQNKTALHSSAGRAVLSCGGSHHAIVLVSTFDGVLLFCFLVCLVILLVLKAS